MPFTKKRGDAARAAALLARQADLGEQPPDHSNSDSDTADPQPAPGQFLDEEVDNVPTIDFHEPLLEQIKDGYPTKAELEAGIMMTLILSQTRSAGVISFDTAYVMFLTVQSALYLSQLPLSVAQVSCVTSLNLARGPATRALQL